MSMIKVKDGTKIYYKDWGTGPAITFAHRRRAGPTPKFFFRYVRSEINPNLNDLFLLISQIVDRQQ